MTLIPAWAVDTALLLVTAALALNAARLFLGPRAADRLVALDSLSVSVAGLFAVLLIKFETSVFFDAVLVAALLGFVGTVALARAIYGGKVFD